MDTRDDFGHTGLDTGLFPEICDVFSAFSDDDAGLLGSDESAEGEDVAAGRRGRTGVGNGA